MYLYLYLYRIWVRILKIDAAGNPNRNGYRKMYCLFHGISIAVVVVVGIAVAVVVVAVVVSCCC